MCFFILTLNVWLVYCSVLRQTHVFCRLQQIGIAQSVAMVTTLSDTIGLQIFDAFKKYSHLFRIF